MHMGHGSQVVCHLQLPKMDLAGRMAGFTQRIDFGMGGDVGRGQHAIMFGCHELVADRDGAAKRRLPGRDAGAAPSRSPTASGRPASMLRAP